MTAPTSDAAPPAEQSVNDLGFGSLLAGATRRRFLNRDGTFNVRRVGLSLAESRSVYRYFLDVSWLRFFSHVGWWYLGTNLIFAVAYLACGPGALEGPEDYGGALAGHFLKAFFFSVQTLATIGYGRISPLGVAANMIVALESVCGLVLFALITGLAFSRFSRPRPRILFSDRAIIAPYGKITGFMFRIANARDNELFDVEAEVSLARRKPGGSVEERLFDSLKLERKSVTFFPLSWTVVHPIDQSSPVAHERGVARGVGGGVPDPADRVRRNDGPDGARQVELPVGGGRLRREVRTDLRPHGGRRDHQGGREAVVGNRAGAAEGLGYSTFHVRPDLSSALMSRFCGPAAAICSYTRWS